MYIFPAGSKHIPTGKFNWALNAVPPSPENPAVPVPAMVVSNWADRCDKVKTKKARQNKCFVKAGKLRILSGDKIKTKKEIKQNY